MNYQNVETGIVVPDCNIESSIQRGTRFLVDRQCHNGEFRIYLSGDDAMQGWNSPENTVFPAALIGSCLLFLQRHPMTELVLKKAEAYLGYQMGIGGSWNHFSKMHVYKNVCPQDADDTSCISRFLEQRGIPFPKSTNHRLLMDNRRSDGMFYTWFCFRFKPNRNKDYWRLVFREFLQPVQTFIFWREMESGRYDVDAIVNANILYYLGEIKETKVIISYLIKIIKENRETDCDKWYRNIFTVYYFISRNYFAGVSALEAVRQIIKDRILARQHLDGRFGDSILDTALAICSLINLRYETPGIERGIHYLLDQQRETGGWDRWIFYYGGPKKIAGYGSEELTTGFCLEALARYNVLYSNR